MDTYTNEIPHVNSCLNTIGARLRWLRLANGHSQSDVARKAHCSRAAVSQWEANRTMPGLDKVDLLLEHYRGVTFEWLFFGRGTPPAVPADTARKRPLRVSLNPTLSPETVALSLLSFTLAEREQTFRIVGPMNVWDALERIIA